MHPALLIGAAVAGIAALAGGRNRAGNDRRVTHTAGAGAPVPTALEVFNAFLREGKQPPTDIARDAAREARAAGINDLAADIEQSFAGTTTLGGGAPMALTSQTLGNGAPISVGKAPSDVALIGLPAGIGAQQADSGTGTGTGSGTGGADLMSAFAGKAATSSSLPMAIQIAPGSPVPGVTAEQWESLCNILGREPSTYNTNRAIGRYRQSKARLRELGVDPLRLVGDVAAQDQAFARDMADSYDHLLHGQVIARVVGRPIVIPDMVESVVVTLPGLLGVCAASGLEGCASWLRTKADRVNYRHTTNLFLRCNAVGQQS